MSESNKDKVQRQIQKIKEGLSDSESMTDEDMDSSSSSSEEKKVSVNP